MESLKEVFKIGCGPSSSHTMGPERAAKEFKKRCTDAKKYQAYLYGSLAATGKGHMTDWIIEKTFMPKPTTVFWDPSFIHPYHTNYMKLVALDEKDNILDTMEVFSIGGGSIREIKNGVVEQSSVEQPYKLEHMTDIVNWCKKNNKKMWEYVFENEDIEQYLDDIYDAMYRCVKRGIKKEGLLPAKLRFKRKAKEMYEKAMIAPESLKLTKKMFAYALASSEENASAGEVVTAPTCGACGVIPAVLVAMVEEFNIDRKRAIRGLAIAGLVGSIIKKNATVSGAEGGCQAEIGSACSMASAMATYFMGGDANQIEYAAESGMEHALGMTCDPIGGYVIVPCIERNAVFSVKALNTANYVMSVDPDHIISFDDVIVTMAETGKDLRQGYRETSTSGLAKYYEKLLKMQQEEGLPAGVPLD